jgi:hypothetical protein
VPGGVVTTAASAVAGAGFRGSANAPSVGAVIVAAPYRGSSCVSSGAFLRPNPKHILR